MSMLNDAYRDYIHANFSPEDADEGMPFCNNEDCETNDPHSDKYARLPEKPAGFVKVRDQILEWDSVNGCPLTWSWIDEPFWKCPSCGTEYSLDDVSR